MVASNTPASPSRSLRSPPAPRFALEDELADEHHWYDGHGTAKSSPDAEQTPKITTDSAPSAAERHRPALHERHQEIALDLLDREVEQGDVEGGGRVVGERDEHCRDRGDDRPDERDELEQGGDRREGERERDVEREEPDAGEDPDAGHRDELAAEPFAQRRRRLVERRGGLRAVARRHEPEKAAAVQPEVRGEVDAEHQHEQQVRGGAERRYRGAEQLERRFGRVDRAEESSTARPMPAAASQSRSFASAAGSWRSSSLNWLASVPPTDQTRSPARRSPNATGSANRRPSGCGARAGRRSALA
jgi:hypothetical protein